MAKCGFLRYSGTKIALFCNGSWYSEKVTCEAGLLHRFGEWTPRYLRRDSAAEPYSNKLPVALFVRVPIHPNPSSGEAD